MLPVVRSILGLLWRLALFLVFAFSLAWVGLALWYQFPGGQVARVAADVVWLAFGLAILIGAWRFHRRWAVVLYPCALVLVAIWWTTIRPSNHRDWAPDVAHTVTAEIHGNTATVHNVRNFEWRTETDFTPRWETRTYNLDELDTVDLFLSYWSGKAIAHTLVSFGFRDGSHLVFSAEIRKERTEAFSEVGGFFREFELAMIAADERDIIRLRTNVRGEDVYRYALDVPEAARRTLLLSFLNKGNLLASRPAFYNTVTSNCTTVVFDMARVIDSRLPLDYRILLSGYLPGYLYDQHVIRTDLPLAEVRARAAVSALGRQAGDAADYSARIRAGS
ncbi:protein of unknown function [Faunimonas pinastri]|uniref:Lnb N-terminal periplasmic domain-containing protein n=1 Tax=Faunimonas pinastri TaxID=1855383 RepID=A0A1H9K8R0_9HYPH|nr:DUF4105 domain-containing protein [Faunimonas pinastri]SEQ95303.1 protein of unknown function [Faunimonas pinastri]